MGFAIRVAIITGAARGIGKAIAKRLASPHEIAAVVTFLALEEESACPGGRNGGGLILGPAKMAVGPGGLTCISSPPS